jgi:DNA ligase (NAD+)
MDFIEIELEDDTEKKLRAAADAYYNKQPIMSDEEFDALKDKLREKDPNNSFLKQIGSPIKVTEWEIAKHKIAMCSLDKVSTPEEFIKWARAKAKSFIINEKFDGISINLEYDNGELIKAITRGDGIEGEDILSNVVKMKNVKTKVDGFTGSIRGEIILRESKLNELNKAVEKAGERTYQNSRNGASGIAKRYDGQYSEYLEIIYYDVANGKPFETEESKLEFIKEQGLEITYFEIADVSKVIEVYEEYCNIKRGLLDYAIDGLVIKINDLAVQNSLGSTHGIPKGQIAFKFPAEAKITKIKEVEWSLGKGGKITPVAIMEPVKLCGANVKRASLHNIDMFKTLNLGSNDEILVKRAGDVIPYVEKVITYVSDSKFEIPKNCSACNSELVEDGKFLVCLNQDCVAHKEGDLHKWIKKLDVKDIGDKLIENLFENGIVKDPADFYTLKIEDVSSLERMGKRSAKKVIEHLNEKKKLELPVFLAALNINDFSESTVTLIAEAGYDTLDKVIDLIKDPKSAIDRLSTIHGIGYITAEKAVYGLNKKISLIEKLLSVGIVIREKKEVEVDSSKLNGASFCFTGAIQAVDEEGKRYARSRLEEMVIQNGGKIESMSKKLDYLVQADPNSQSSKSVKAKKFGVEIISEKQFFEILD